MNRKRGGLLFLAAGLLLAFLLYRNEHPERRVRFVLGEAAPKVTRFTVDYAGQGGTDLRYSAGDAPRVIEVDSTLPNGPYHLRIDVERNGQTTALERDVTFSGSSASVDLVDDLRR